MVVFKSEIRNAPTQQIIKIFLNDESLDREVKDYLESFNEVEYVEIRKSVERNRTSKNIAVYGHQGIDINALKLKIDEGLIVFFDDK